MKVIDLLENVQEGVNVNVVCNGVIVSCYNGRDSIDEKYNNCEVIDVDIFDNDFFLEIVGEV